MVTLEDTRGPGGSRRRGRARGRSRCTGSRSSCAPSGCSRSSSGCSGCSMRPLQIQPYLFGQGFVGQLQDSTSRASPSSSAGPDHAPSSTSSHPDIRGVERVLRAHPARHRGGPALPPYRAPGARPVLRVGGRRVVRRRGPGHAPHRDGVRAHGRAGLGADVRAARPDGVAPVAGARHGHVQAETDNTHDPDDDLVGVASSAAAQGIGGSVTPLAVWAGYWSLTAVLFLLPNNRTSTSVHSAIAGMVPSQPGWYGHVLSDVSNQFTSTGALWAWILAAASLVCRVPPLYWRGKRDLGSSPARCSPSSCGCRPRGSSATSSPGPTPTPTRDPW